MTHFFLDELATLLGRFGSYLYRSGFFALPEFGTFTRSDPYHEAVQMAEAYTVGLTRRGVGCGLLLLASAYLVEDTVPPPLVTLALVLPWAVTGACVAFVIARRILLTPLLFAEPMRLRMEIAEEGPSDSLEPSDARRALAEWRWEYVTTHMRDLIASVAMLALLFASASRGALVFCASAIALALGIHVGWYAWKRWYLMPRVSHALQTRQLVFRVDWS